MPSLVLAWRSLRRSPAFTITAVATLAIGIGATTAISTVLRAVVLQPLPYADADRLVSVRLAAPGLGGELGQSLATYFPFKQYARSFDAIGVYDPTAVDVTDLSRSVQAEHRRAALVSANVFSLLGAKFELGRGFTNAEDAPHGAPVIILSDGLWRARFGADRAILGKRIVVDGQEREVVGVAKAFQFPDALTQMWLPIALDPLAPYARDFRHRCIGKLRPGVTLSSAMHELDGLLPRAPEQFPELFPGVPTAEFLTQSRAHTVVRPLREEVVGSIGRILWIATAAGALILLTACANVASLILARADHRQREIAVRTALGASWRWIVSQHIAEAIGLAVLGGGAGLVLAEAGLAALRHAGATEIPRVAEVHFDSGVLLLVLILTVSVTFLATAIPILHPAADIASSLRDHGRTGASGPGSQRARRAFVVVQVTFAVILSSGAILLVRSFDRLRHVDPGFDTGHTLVLWLSLPKTTYPTDAEMVRFTDRLLGRVAAEPRVRAAGVTSMVPLNRLGRSFSPIWTDNDATPAGSLPPAVLFTTATGDYFRAMGMPLIAGRTFQPLSQQRAAEIIIDQTVAKTFWHDSTGTLALGHRLRYTAHDTPWYTVVGVVPSVRDTSLAAPPMGQIYFPDVHPPDSTFEGVARTFAVVARYEGSSAPAMVLRKAIRDLDPTIAVYDMNPLANVIAASTARLSFVMIILAVSAGVALTLAAIGLYGVIAYIVALRTAEIGLRIALGAPPERVARLVTYQAATLAAIGIAVGVSLFAVLSRSLGSLVFGVGVVDPLTLLATTVILLVVAVGASWLPARRAARVDPVRALTGDVT